MAQVHYIAAHPLLGSLVPNRPRLALVRGLEGSRIHCLPALLCPGATGKMFDIKFMTAAGVVLLVAIFVLMSCVTSLLCKLIDILKAPKIPGCLALKSNPFTVTQDKITAASSVTAASYLNSRCCEGCKLPADFDPLPPCFCDAIEGL
ncbi:LOW QUALITY PROTEIN: protein FAM24A [Sturnira hondurensis]|uniref:LOW QUALITY PROTEIN: protein FAM24A n=1 Tax=Sturnira hondurensis TaxID=192404 RepID=UPI001879088D|nr:LOW QUALITY PROTEIN: protein FAM24A [Sturnira hondurensis]